MAPSRTPERSLDQPLPIRRGFRHYLDPDLFGRFSERVARFLGSGTFIVWMTLVVIAWVVYNVTGWSVDPYPFIFLTLLLSLQASYAAPLILLAANRQADRDRVQYAEDRSSQERLIADTEYLTREIASLRIALGEVATRDYVRSELRSLLDELDARDEARELTGEHSKQESLPDES